MHKKGAASGNHIVYSKAQAGGLLTARRLTAYRGKYGATERSCARRPCIQAACFSMDSLLGVSVRAPARGFTCCLGCLLPTS